MCVCVGGGGRGRLLINQAELEIWSEFCIHMVSAEILELQCETSKTYKISMKLKFFIVMYFQFWTLFLQIHLFEETLIIKLHISYYF